MRDEREANNFLPFTDYAAGEGSQLGRIAENLGCVRPLRAQASEQATNGPQLFTNAQSGCVWKLTRVCLCGDRVLEGPNMNG